MAGILTVFYVVFAHYVSTTDGIGAWAILVAGVPILLAVVGIARNSRFGLLLIIGVVAALVLLGWLWSTLDNPLVWLYFLQNAGVSSALAILFGRTLMAGRRPLVTTFAAAVHEEMSPLLLRYTRQVTFAWMLFFIVCALVSVMLFFVAPIEAWSWFANVLMLPLIGLMFIVEYGVRKYVLPKRDQVGLITTVRAVCASFRQ
jgi:uncharacterized membrane protein